MRLFSNLIYEMKEGSREVVTATLLVLVRKINRRKDDTLAHILREIAYDYDKRGRPDCFGYYDDECPTKK